MSNTSPKSTENKLSDTSNNRPKEMTVDEYADLVAKWQQSYYMWNSSSVNYYK